MKYSEAKKEIEALSSKYSAYKDKDTEFFNVYYKNREVAYVRTNKRYSVTVWFEKYFPKLPFSNKLYMILSELAMTPLDERLEAKKYHVKINGLSLSTGEGLYLNFDPINGNYFVSILNKYFKNKFTDDEIDELVNDPDFFLQTGNYETDEDE